MPLLSSRIRPLLALMQGLLRTVRGGRLAPHADVPPLGLSSVTTRGRTATIERLGARWGTSPAARPTARPRHLPHHLPEAPAAPLTSRRPPHPPATSRRSPRPVGGVAVRA